MPPNRFRRPVVGEAAEEKAPDDGLPSASLPSTSRRMTKADLARLMALIEKELDGPVRCDACHRPLHALRSVLAGIGPTCRRKYPQRRTGGVQ